MNHDGNFLNINGAVWPKFVSHHAGQACTDCNHLLTLEAYIF